MLIAVMARGFITDNLQRFFRYPESGWTHALTRSRISRALSGITKMLAFTSLASAGFLRSPALEQGSLILATIAVHRHWASDESLWMRRSRAFSVAMQSAKFSETAQVHHPGAECTANRVRAATGLFRDVVDT